jgi:NAD(P)-dependent dehydrogenase (short-subunit alcohol dehydrogenase family)
VSDFQGRVGLVTGAGSGIGRASAVGFAARGASVLVCDIDDAGGQATVEAITGAGGTASFLHVDVGNAADIEGMVPAAVDRYGRLDFAHNNAGIPGAPAPLADYGVDEWHRVLAVNLTGVFLCMKHEITQMLENGGGAIVNTSSLAGITGWAMMPAYTASKHGILGLTRNAGLDYAKRGIRVNAICPGVTRSAMTEDFLSRGIGTEEMLTAKTPMGRMAPPEEIAAAAIWLCSDAAAFVTGITVPVDGGQLAEA